MIFVTVFEFTRANASFFLGSHALTGAKSTRFSHYSVYSVQPKAPGGQKRWPGKIVSKTAENGMAQPSRFLFFGFFCTMQQAALSAAPGADSIPFPPGPGTRICNPLPAVQPVGSASAETPV